MSNKDRTSLLKRWVKRQFHYLRRCWWSSFQKTIYKIRTSKYCIAIFYSLSSSFCVRLFRSCLSFLPIRLLPPLLLPLILNRPIFLSSSSSYFFFSLLPIPLSATSWSYSSPSPLRHLLFLFLFLFLPLCFSPTCFASASNWFILLMHQSGIFRSNSSECPSGHSLRNKRFSKAYLDVRSSILGLRSTEIYTDSLERHIKIVRKSSELCEEGDQTW